MLLEFYILPFDFHLVVPAKGSVAVKSTQDILSIRFRAYLPVRPYFSSDDKTKVAAKGNVAAKSVETKVAAKSVNLGPAFPSGPTFQ